MILAKVLAVIKGREGHHLGRAGLWEMINTR